MQILSDGDGRSNTRREMQVLSDGDLSDPFSEGRSNTRCQRRKLVEGESSRTGELTAPVVERAYNLRPRMVDPLTLQRRWEFSRSREQKLERNRVRFEKRKERSLVDREFIEMFARKVLELTKDLPVEETIDSKNRTEIINGRNAIMETEKWRPYFLPPDIGLFKTTLKGASWRNEKLALQASPSVVGLEALTVGDKYLFACSGTIVKSSENVQQIVTVANLVKKGQDMDEVADGLMINVYFQNHETCKGDLLYYDFNYNMCVIQIESPVHLLAKGFCSQAINFDNNCSSDVVALYRDRERHLMVSTGKIIPKCSMLDCEELFVSTCRISQAGVGGPLMNMDGKFVGMNCYQKKETSFIPGFIVLKCLQQFELCGKVIKPWHGLQVRTLYAEGSHAFGKIQTKSLRRATSVIVKKIEKLSSAEASGLNEGDIINQVNGVYCSNAAELGGMLMDLATAHLLGSRELCIKYHVVGCERERTIVVDKPMRNGLNRWPFQKPIIVRKYIDGEVDSEEWYTLDSYQGTNYKKEACQENYSEEEESFSCL